MYAVACVCLQDLHTLQFSLSQMKVDDGDRNLEIFFKNVIKNGGLKFKGQRCAAIAYFEL